jgi:hypothetical protein
LSLVFQVLVPLSYGEPTAETWTPLEQARSTAGFRRVFSADARPFK